MNITTESRIADIATSLPATIKVFQQHQIDCCCGGRIPLAEACAHHGLDPSALIAELQTTQRTDEDHPDWDERTLSDLISHIQQRYHEPLRLELPRLGEMLEKVLRRHGDHVPQIPLLQAAFEPLRDELLDHMMKEDVILFPAIVVAESALEHGSHLSERLHWIEQPIATMEAEHESAGAAIATMRELTRGYAPPADACPTFRGLYYGLAALERDMHVHVHLENNVLFRRAAGLARRMAG